MGNMALLDEDLSKSGKDPYAPPDGGWGWVVMIAAFICCLVLDGIAYVFGVFLEPLMEDFQVDNATMSAVGSVLSGVIQLVGPFVALLAPVPGSSWPPSCTTSLSSCCSSEWWRGPGW